jgi:ABC-type multidrug transport system ATPase subunit
LRIIRSTKKDVTILKGLNGSIEPGRLTLLLGPPSSGKTTLLKALSGKLRKGGDLKVIPPTLLSYCLYHGHNWKKITCVW